MSVTDFFDAPDPLQSPSASTLKPTPQAYLKRADDEAARIARERADADAKVSEIGKKRDALDQTHQAQREDDERAYKGASDDAIAAVAQGPERAAMPTPRLPSAIDGKEAQQFLFGLLGVAAISGRGSKTNYKNALAAATGAIKGFNEGNVERAKEEHERYDRELKAAMEEQKRLDLKYKEIVEAKGLTATQKLQLIQLHATDYKDEIMSTTSAKGEQTEVLKQLKERETANGKLRDQAIKWDKSFKKQVAQETAKEGGQFDGIETAAWDRIITGHSPPARGGMYEKVMTRVGDIAKAQGMTVPELMALSADAKTKLAAKRNFEVRAQNMQRAEKTLGKEIPVMEDAMSKLDLPSIPILARGDIFALRQLGDPNVAKLDQAAEVVFNEFEGIVTGNPGTLNVQDVQSARQNYQHAQTPQQMKAVIEGMRRIIKNAKDAIGETRKDIMDDIVTPLTEKRGNGGAGGGPQVLKFDAQGNPVQ